MVQYGKPYLAHMKYVEDYVLQSHKHAKTIYMIGDNLSTDILGGNTIAKSNQEQKNRPRWVTIAVRSGIY